MASKCPHGVVDALMKKHHLKLKGTCPMSYHLGCYFGSDGDGTSHFGPRKHIEKIEECYHIIFWVKKQTNFHATVREGWS